jgi:hypothetical protein
MSDVKWLLENYEGNEDIQFLLPEFKKRNIEYYIINDPLHINIENIPFSNDECVVFQGSLMTSNFIKRHFKFIPGVYCNSENLKCSTYYSHWGKYLFNNDYIMIPLFELYRKIDYFLNLLGDQSGSIFIRPNSGHKTFTGGVYNKEKLLTELKLLGDINNSSVDNILAIVSSPKKIQKEWRIIIADKKPIASCLYMEDDQFNTKEGCDREALGLAEIIAQESWQPEMCYSVDICKMNNEYYLLELNSFSCLGLYSCDPGKIIKGVSEVALKEYNDYNNI